MANTTITYNNPNRPNANKVDNSNRFKINNAALNMMARNPSLGIGYIIGNMLGENYWGKKRNKSSQDAVDDFYKKNGIGADSNGVYGVNNSNAKTPSYEGRSGVIDWDSMNKALDNIPRTPQQANKPAVTTENAGTTGGVPTVADAWNNMVNGSTYNPGNTTLFTNGARNMGNVIGADANGVYGVPGANPGVFIDTAKGIYSGGSQQPANPGVYIDTAKGIYPGGSQQAEQPAGPTPYTDDQLRQIQGQNFSAEELVKMASPEELARMIVMMRGGSPVASAPSVAYAQPRGDVSNSVVQDNISTTPAEMERVSNTTTDGQDIGKIMQQAAAENAVNNTPIVADAVPIVRPNTHGGVPRGGGGGTGAFGPTQEYVDPAPNVPVENNPYRIYGLNGEDDVSTGGLLSAIIARANAKRDKYNDSF